MKIAYYEENNYHTEIIGTFLEPYINETIIIFNDGDKSNYIDWFIKKINFDIKLTDEFMNFYKDFDIIYIGTSSSFKFFNQIFLQEDEKEYIEKKPKIFLINHLKEDVLKNQSFNGIVLTPLNKIENQIYVLPINNLYKETEKNLNSEKPITICLVGRFKDSNRDVSDLIKLINEYNHLNFQIIIYTRHKKFIPYKLLKIKENFNNKIIIHYKSSTDFIINSLKNIMYFCPLSSKDSCYTKDRLTGMIPFSYNFNTPLLLDEQTNSYYNFKSPIIYKKSICEIIERICKIDYNEYKQLVSTTVLEKEEICKHNLSIINNIL